MAPDGQEGNELPSQKVYEALGKNGNTSSCDTTTVEQSTLFMRTYVNTHKDEIKNACCYGRTIEESGLSKEDRCGFLFYWIIDKIKTKLQDDKYLQATKDVYQLLNSFKPEWQCSKIYDGMGEPLFMESKKLFDFDYNYRTLQKSSLGNPQPCWPQYNEDWEAAKKEYEKMGRTCDTDNTCTAFMKKYDQHFKDKAQPPKLECAEVSKEEKKKEESEEGSDDEDVGDDLLIDLEDEDDEVDLAEGTLGVKNLKELPSHREFYDMFERGMTNCQQYSKGESWPNQMKNGLKGDIQDIKKYAEQTVGAFCYASTKKNSPPTDSEMCKFLYFWLGKMLWKEIKPKKAFSSTMKKILSIVKDWQTDHGCTFTCNNGKHRKFFQQRKLLYEYLKDKDTIEQQIKGGTASCTQKYLSYLEKITAAYMNMYAQRNGKQWHQICKEFGEIVDQEVWGKLNEVDKLKCSVVTTTKNGATSASYPSEGSNSATINKITPIVSSVLGIGALPLTAFLLYKYNILPPWFHNQLRKIGARNARKRRGRSIGHHHFENDTFTEDNSTITDSTDMSAAGDSSTLYSGDTSTELSTVADNSIDNVTVYTRRPRTGRTGPKNNRRAKQQQRQRRKQPQRNIAYQNM